MVSVDLKKRDFFWMGFVVILLGVGVVVAYGGSDPVVMGHSSGEVMVDIGGVDKTLQAAIDDGDFGGTVSFGDWVDLGGGWIASMDGGPVATDGFIVVYGKGGMSGYTDGSNPSVTERVRGEGSGGFAGFTMPVKQGDYWRVTGALDVKKVFWIPLL